MALGAIADKAFRVFAGKVDRERHAADQIGVVAIDQPLGAMQCVELIGIEDGLPGAEAHL